jgi:non-ribosomal peptide synthetase component F
MVLLAVFQALLWRRSGHDGPCVGVPVAGRPQRELEGLVGFFSNTLVMRGDLSGSPTFRVLLRRVRDSTLQAFAHQDLPFARLAAALRPDSAPGDLPLFRAVFDLEQAGTGGGGELRLPRVRAGSFQGSRDERRPLRADLRLNLSDDGTRVAGGLAYRTDVLDAAAAERLAREFETLAAEAAAHPDRPLAELALSTEVP